MRDAIVVAVIAALLGGGNVSRRWLLLALAAVWGLRLSGYIYRRSSGPSRGCGWAPQPRSAQNDDPRR
jgi:steroid 5-alpha reductase family enzyme